MNILKTSFGICAVFFLSMSLFAQEKKQIPAHVGIFYPLSTNGVKAAEYQNNFSLHLLTGISGGENGFALYGLAGMVKGDVTGAQISGLWNHTSGKVKGVQVAGLLNQAANTSEAGQIAGLANLSQENAVLQVSGIFNKAKDIKSLQVAGIATLAANVDGLQAAGITSISHDMRGLQMGGIANVSNKIKGIQAAGISNISGEVDGLQVSGLVNTAKDVKGTQIAGLVNRAGIVKGVQIAGLVNIADSSDYTIALINIVKNGEMRIGVSTDENLSSLVTFRSGGNKLYGLVGIGTTLNQRDFPYVFEGGLGIKLFESKILRADAEVFSQFSTNFERSNFYKSGIRVLPIITVSERLQLFAGPSLSYSNSDEDYEYDQSGINIWDKHNLNSDQYHSVQLGFTAGIQFKIR